jgi:hypothetical protein
MYFKLKKSTGYIQNKKMPSIGTPVDMCGHKADVKQKGDRQ